VWLPSCNAVRAPQWAQKNAWLWTIAGAVFLAIFALGAPFPLIVLGAGIAGDVGGRIAPARFATAASHDEASDSGAPPVLIDDRNSTPSHARFT